MASISLLKRPLLVIGMLAVLGSIQVDAQTPTPKTPKTPSTPATKETPPTPILDEQQLRDIDKQLEENKKLLEEYRKYGRGERDTSILGGAIQVSAERVEIGGDVVVQADEVVSGDVVAVGGNVDVYGKVEGDAVSVGGRVHVHDEAVIEGDAVAVGGSVEIDETADVQGERVSVKIGLPPFRFWRADQEFHGLEKPRFWGLAANFIWVAATLLLSLLYFAVAGGRLDVVSRRVEAQPGQSFLIGLLGVFATPIATAITAVLLVVTIIGIFLVPVLFLLLMLMFAGGFVAVALAVGRRIMSTRPSMGTLAPTRSAYLLLVVGFLALHGLLFLGNLLGSVANGLPIFPGMLKGFGIFTLVFSMLLGYGALLLSRFGTQLPTDPGSPGIPPVYPHYPPAPPSYVPPSYVAPPDPPHSVPPPPSSSPPPGSTPA